MPDQFNDHNTLTEEEEAYLDRDCDAFEMAWKTGQRPSIQQVLEEAPAGGALRARLLRELIALEVNYRRQRGELPTREEYRDLFPNDDIDAVWSTILFIPSDCSPEVDQSTPVPERIGRYKVCRKIDGGTYGDVYLGQDDAFDRQVAIKVPSPKLLASQTAIDHFLSEARNVGRLEHEGIVRAYDFGREADGICYIVYEYIEGTTLAKRIKPERLAVKPLMPDQAAGLVAQLALALHYAHLQRLYHRDIKPANILLDRQGRPRITDFGLAIREEDLANERGRQAGTRAYMSPEQVRRQGHHIDGRTDIYSLGVILYELLCGRRPFEAKTKNELEDQILHREAKPPRQIKDSIPQELERVCLKALSKRVQDRFTTAKDMADELWAAISAERFPKTARPPAQRSVPKAQDEFLSPMDITEQERESNVEHGEALNLPTDRTVSNPHAYKLVVKTLLQTKLMNEGLATLRAYHLKSYKGRSGQMHEIDVSFEIQVGELELLFIAGCNDSGRKVTLDEIMAFSYCLRDIGAHKGLLVSTIGFDDGTVELARTERIALLTARKGRVAECWLGCHPTYVPHWVHRFEIAVKEKESELQLTGLPHVTCNTTCDAVPFETSLEARPEGAREFNDLEGGREFGDLVYFLLPEEVRSNEAVVLRRRRPF
jgi:serine/threonine protein kinase